MLRFSPNDLRQKLSPLPHVARVAFALACSERLASFIGDKNELSESVRAAVLQFVLGSNVPGLLDSLAARLEASPELDRDDIAACAYVLDCARRNDVQAAVWAAQRACDARDQHVQDELDFLAYTAEIEAGLLCHPLVQAELSSQARDIADLVEDPRSSAMIVRRAVSCAF
jgi:hypothetical protein